MSKTRLLCVCHEGLKLKSPAEVYQCPKVGHWSVFCTRCNRQGEIFLTKDNAVNAWNLMTVFLKRQTKLIKEVGL